ncbi:MAG: short-chain dehydrogenase [Chloroflexi bacterium]|nr:short-chain dehydrogenase [Chloroflexota bacterium]|tara:strand:+ start:883 stop:1716 length:834 start_codon:yes stop_codon:yes gene_type:complete
MITGSTSGIGKETAIDLAKRGAVVILVGRNPQKTTDTANYIKAETGNENIYSYLCDLSSQSSIHKLVKETKNKFHQLHVLINNAGAVFLSRRRSIDNIEMTFALNHLSYFILSNLLLEIMESSESARIINVSSVAHKSAKFTLSDLETHHNYMFGFKAYCRSKLANLLFTYELARRLRKTKITVNALHPGVVSTNLLINNGFVGQIGNFFLGLRGITPKKGAETSIYLATSQKVEGFTGRYYVDCKESASSPASYDQEAATKLWDISKDLTGLTNTI